MKLTKTLVSLMVGFSTPALATLTGFAGAYQGSGQAADSNGWDSPCPHVTLAFVETATSLSFSNMRYVCGSLGANHDPLLVMKRGQDLYLDQKKVGSFSDTEVDLIVPFDHLANTSYVARLVKKNGQVLYTEDWLSFQDGSYVQVFEMGSSLDQQK